MVKKKPDGIHTTFLWRPKCVLTCVGRLFKGTWETEVELVSKATLTPIEIQTQAPHLWCIESSWQPQSQSSEWGICAVPSVTSVLGLGCADGGKRDSSRHYQPNTEKYNLQHNTHSFPILPLTTITAPFESIFLYPPEVLSKKNVSFL